MKKRRDIYKKLWLHAESDSAALDLLGTLLQDAPQMVLQLFIMTKTMPAMKPESQFTSTSIKNLRNLHPMFHYLFFSSDFSNRFRLCVTRDDGLDRHGLRQSSSSPSEGTKGFKYLRNCFTDVRPFYSHRPSSESFNH